MVYEYSGLFAGGKDLEENPQGKGQTFAGEKSDQERSTYSLAIGAQFKVGETWIDPSGKDANGTNPSRPFWSCVKGELK